MSSKQDSTQAALDKPVEKRVKALDFGLLAITGSGASDFLQRQTMNDVRTLTDLAPAQRSGLLSAEGRVLHLFVLFRRTDDQFILVCPDHDQHDIATHLKRFIFRSKIGIEVDPPYQACAGEGAPPTAAFCWDDERWLVVVEADGHEVTEGLWPLDSWRQRDIIQGIAHLPEVSRGRYTPHMLGLQRWHALSLSKGCYPGQEIVSRTHYLGRHKRDLCAVRCDSRMLHAGDALLQEGRMLGNIVCAQDHLALAVLPMPFPAQLLTEDDHAVSACE